LKKVYCKWPLCTAGGDIKIGIFSDVHGNLNALKAVLEAFKEKKADRIICLGDLVGYFHQSLEVLDEVMASDISVIMGNHDAYAVDQLPYTKVMGELINIDYVRKGMSLQQRQWVKALPLSLEIAVNGKRIACYHGSPWSPLEGYIYPDYPDFNKFLEFNYNYILLGHTHYPLLKNAGQLAIINPGSCGQPREGDYKARAVILDVINDQIDFLNLEYDIRGFLADARKHGVNEKALHHLAASIKD
jgi:putative phosphoesterase